MSAVNDIVKKALERKVFAYKPQGRDVELFKISGLESFGDYVRALVTSSDRGRFTMPREYIEARPATRTETRRYNQSMQKGLH